MPAILHGQSGRIVLGPTIITFGRAPDNHLVIPGASVAPRHAEIRSASLGGRRSYSLIDRGSSTGTFLNERRLTAQVPHLLTTGIASASVTRSSSTRRAKVRRGPRLGRLRQTPVRAAL